MGELIELAESLRSVLEELARSRRSEGGAWRMPSQEENTAWCRLYRAEGSIREFDAEMTAMQEARANSMGEEG